MFNKTFIIIENNRITLLIIIIIRRQQGEKPYANSIDNPRYRTLSGEQPSDMLKFVRKIDSDNTKQISSDQVN